MAKREHEKLAAKSMDTNLNVDPRIRCGDNYLHKFIIFYKNTENY